MENFDEDHKEKNSNPKLQEEEVKAPFHLCFIEF